MTAWIYAITDSTQENRVRISYIDADPETWAGQQIENVQVQYAVLAHNPHLIKQKTQQYLSACKCQPNNKHDDWFECDFLEAITVMRWLTAQQRHREFFANEAAQHQQKLEAEQRQKIAQAKKIKMFKMMGLILLVVGSGVGAWWYFGR